MGKAVNKVSHNVVLKLKKKTVEAYADRYDLGSKPKDIYERCGIVSQESKDAIDDVTRRFKDYRG